MSNSRKLFSKLIFVAIIVGILVAHSQAGLALQIDTSSLTTGPAPAPTTIEVASTITAIEVRGNKLVPTQDIMKVIFSRTGETILEEKLKADAKAINALGYFADVNTSFEAFKQGTKVLFQVTENPKVEEIIISGNTVYTTKEISALIKTKLGEILNYQVLQEDIEAINSRYQKDGYIFARVIDVDIDKSGLLNIKIVEGVIESITLNGNKSTQDYVILRELDTKPGTVLNENVLKKDLRRVFNLGFFSAVNPKFEPGSSKDKIALELTISESRTSTVNFGGGYGEREGWFGFADLSVNNLMGTAQSVLVRGQSGQSLSTYEFKYYNPWLFPEKFGKRTSFTFKRWYTVGRDIYLTSQDARYNGFDISLGRPLTEDYKIAGTLGSEVVSPHSTSTFETYQSDTIGLTLSYDTRDFWLNPTAGRYYSFSVLQGWKHTTGTSTFFKLGMDLNSYYSVVENQVLAAHLGTGIGFGDVPFGEEYWAGGANTVRGYETAQVHRGTRKLICNLEYRLNFSDMFQGVFFLDWGNAWSLGAPVPEGFLAGWGPGIRVNTPLGPIRLDYGVPTTKTFSEGVLHFSIGQAF